MVLTNCCWPAGKVHFAMAIQKAPRPWSIGGRAASVAMAKVEK